MNAVPAPHPRTGERVPEFLLPPVGGVPTTFYERYCGRPAVLLLGADAQALAPFAPLAQRVDVMGLVPGPGGKAVEAPVPAMGDDGRLARALDEQYPSQGAVAWLLDGTLRRVARVPASRAEDVCSLLDEFPESVVQEAVIRQATAPVLMLPGVLTPTLCESLIRRHDADHFDSGMVRMVDGQPALVPDHSVKRRLDHRLEDEELVSRVSEHLSRRVLPGIATAFNYRVTRFEPFKVVCYESGTGGYFRRHRDNVTPDARHRRFALSINLNEDYQGGSLVFPEFGPEGYRPPMGGAIVFSGGLLHEATDVVAGRRYVLLSFLWGDEGASV
ncbi:2OG-Fe(II) oxygenase family protein [Thioalkalivibrio sulfidiphilus]|uniref:2OG-Fe(II) oxygenase family protein n=1 Tax=Thioalkalivibrio sulfidiphilus TaxID=1033854 RepID=UPI0003AAD8B5|nr:2OG-Fe(II) oxygenase [Thioalkalivibrio sulfidiphilus]